MEDSPAADAGASSPAPSDSPAGLSQLSARVAELEQQVATLNHLLIGAQPRPVHIPPRRPLTPTPAPAAPPPIPSPAFIADEQPTTPLPPKKSLEDRLGSQVFNLIGIVALIFGSAWALKLAIEHGLVGPAARVVIGLAAGAGLILWSELFRRRQLAAFSYSLKAVGTGVLYLSLWASFHLYGLLSAPVALIAMLLVTAWNAFMAFAQDAELLAAYALVGALLTPMLLSTGSDHETFLFTYLAVIDLAIVALLRAKMWPRLLPPAFLAMAAYFVGYYARFFHNDFPRVAEWDGKSTETALFALIFFALFAVVSTKLWIIPQTTGTIDEPAPPLRHQRDILIPVLLPLANAVFVSLALYSVFQDSGLHTSLAWLMAALAAVFLGLMQIQKTTLAAAMHLACAVVFLTIAIPLKASGHTLTTAWLVEGLVLYWASTRFQQENEAPSRVLSILSAGGYILGLISVVWHWAFNDIQSSFLNANLGSALVAVASLAAAAWLSLPQANESTQPHHNDEKLAVLFAALSAIDAVALLLTTREFATFFDLARTGSSPLAAFANPDFATALVGVALLAATSWVSWRIFRLDAAAHHLFRTVAAVDLVLFNLVTILVIEHEIGNLWSRQQADLQRSLAISAFLMLYAGILLAAGFWRRNAFIRWQALILILFTIAKVFLYDISGLSAGYRVASFLALGALLLTVSYAYQKDWLNLKSPAAHSLSDEEQLPS